MTIMHPDTDTRFTKAGLFAHEGSKTPQRFIAYGALYGAPLGDDNLPVSRKDYTYAESTTGQTLAHLSGHQHWPSPDHSTLRTLLIFNH